MASISVPSTVDQKDPQRPVGLEPESAATRSPAGSSTPTRPSAGSRILTAENAKATGKFLQAFGKTAVGMHPLWLMGEAVTGKKPGTQLKAGSKELVTASEAMRDLLATSTSDIIIIVNEKLREKGGETAKTADVIKQAGDNAIVVVSSSIEKAQDQLMKNSPALKRSIQKNGKQVVIVVDKALKNPLVITGVHKFAKSQGIPHPEAILTVASLALSKILATFPTDEELAAMELAGGHIDEIDAADLERMSSKEADAEAKVVGREAAAGVTQGEKKGGNKDGGCIVM